ncbi:hypothetical protein AMTRI_Chr01g135340 [Amborella trichopoda]
MALNSLQLICSSSFPVTRIELKGECPRLFNCFSRSQTLRVQNESGGEVPGQNGSGRRIWRRRKLTKKDRTPEYRMERIPFLEEQIRSIRQSGRLMALDIEKLMLREENRFDFVNEVAEEAKAYVENDLDEYGHKKAILHVLSNRMNDAGFYRPEAYMEEDPFKPGPTYLKEDNM